MLFNIIPYKLVFKLIKSVPSTLHHARLFIRRKECILRSIFFITFNYLLGWFRYLVKCRKREMLGQGVNAFHFTANQCIILNASGQLDLQSNEFFKTSFSFCNHLCNLSLLTQRITFPTHKERHLNKNQFTISIELKPVKVK